ncbi:MAG TPA: GNAT family N-acetyltransferase [Vicinamibacterales bacterium]|jgi:ribosomal-protein-alanine N-acetyltransferase
MQEPLPVLMGRRVLLREPREGDAVAIFEHTSDPEVTRFLAFDPPRMLEETELFIARTREHRLQDREYVFVIADVGTDRPLGVTGLRHLDLAMCSAQIGTWVARPCWGTGINDEAKRLLLDYAFGALGLHRIEARIPSPHLRSRRAFEKLGAVCEGTLRESFSKHGQYLDTSLYVVFSSDWKRIRNARDEIAVTTGFTTRRDKND